MKYQNMEKQGASFHCLDKTIMIVYMDLKYSAAVNFGMPKVLDKTFRTQSHAETFFPKHFELNIIVSLGENTSLTRDLGLTLGSVFACKLLKRGY